MNGAVFGRRTQIFAVALRCMKSSFPITGSARLLEQLSPHVPDAFSNDLLPQPRGPGRRRDFSSAQLWRVQLLSVLTPAHSFNLLASLLPEQRDWRRFAHLANRQHTPEPWMLHEFRDRSGVWGLRRINEHLVEPLLPPTGDGTLSVALIDATDLPASAHGFKKRTPASTRPGAPLWERAP
jgi:hypothetical protein